MHKHDMFTALLAGRGAYCDTRKSTCTVMMMVRAVNKRARQGNSQLKLVLGLCPCIQPLAFSMALPTSLCILPQGLQASLTRLLDTFKALCLDFEVKEKKHTLLGDEQQTGRSQGHKGDFLFVPLRDAYRQNDMPRLNGSLRLPGLLYL
ncbi:hypothetical protein EYF80_012638 [Liparis tanakae]|uniref:Uncharacterized protein n=1 Tax=Liparis tanakae TaxID=230148 RepID=A0A4Z2IGL8_9TELE|nr:hypothetical protein EYF80_012638 [Liparis tanakae]